MDPYKKLATVLEARMAGHAASAVSGIHAELGTITDSGLKLDSFKHELTDYLVADWEATLRLPAFAATAAVSGLRDSEGGAVTGNGTFAFDAVDLEGVGLRFKDALGVGDRVLAIPVAGGSEAVVLCKVVR